MKVQCKNCLPKEGIEIPDFTDLQKKEILEWKEVSKLNMVKQLMHVYDLSHLISKYIVTHICNEYGKCHKCSETIAREYENCSNCEALNINWR